jgi:hypothetical protein
MELVKLTPRFPDECDKEMVATLEVWLERAKEGRFSGLALVGVCKDGSVDHETPSRTDHPKLVGGVTILLHNLLNDVTVSDIP